MKNIAYQGIIGSYSYFAAQNYFGSDNNLIGTKNFRAIFELVNSKRVEYGIIPIENSLAGTIYENYDLFSHFNVHITGEYILNIEHCLLGIPNPKLKGDQRVRIIKKVFSHPKALEQCQKFLLSHSYIEEVQYFDTARASKFVADQKDITIAAIAGEECAKLYSLEIIKENIEDDKENWTRFLIISKKIRISKTADKCTVLITLPHIPGELWRTLKVFSDLDTNLSQIETRPIKGRPFEYMFFIDYELPQNIIVKVRQVINKLRKRKGNVRILGFYNRPASKRKPIAPVSLMFE